MKKQLFLSFILSVLCLFPKVHFGQAPRLGATSSFAAFTAAGAFSSSGATSIVGDIGTYVGSFTGTPTLSGTKHVADAVAKTAADDVMIAYSDLSGLTCGSVIGVGLGGNQTLTPNIYCTGAASTLNGDLTFDAQNNPSAIFVIKVNGALATGKHSKIILKNGASFCNIYWQVNGAFTLGDSSLFYGTVIGSGAITLLDASVLIGRTLTTAGAIDINNSLMAVGKTSSVSITNGATLNICLGSSVILNTSIPSGMLPFTYNWSPGGSTSSSITVAPTSTTSYIVTGSAMNGCFSATDTIKVNVNTPPVITLNPSNKSECVGGSTSFTVAATGTGLTYQWRKGNSNVVNGNGISGANSATLTINPIALGNGGNYYAIVSGVCPPKDTSGTASLTVSAATVITKVPTNQAGCVGGSIQFTTTATGTGLTYQWRKGNTNLTNGSGISGATTATLTINPLSTGDAGTNYNVIVKSTCGK